MRFCCLLALLLIGCGASSSPLATTPVETPEPKFKGEPAEQRVNWSLAGTWNVQRFGTAKNPGKLGAWETKWNIRQHEDHQGYFDPISGDEFWLSMTPVGETVNGVTRVADFLVWKQTNGKRWYFSINEQSFGLLMMTGNDDERYMAVRSD